MNYGRDIYANTLSGSATIAEGSSYVDVQICPVADFSVNPGGRTVQLTLTSAYTFNLGSQTSASLTIQDRPLRAAEAPSATLPGLKYEFYDNTHSGWPNYTGA